MKNMIRALVVTLFCLAVYAPGLSAQEKGYELKSATATVKDILSENLGKRVIVRMDTGDNLEGTVNKVGDSVAHISKISGREYYDAVVRIDKISAVIFKVRGN
jgi:ABC-type phosphate/phosphonate transport system substrate-binding protein